ncbi:hypothetical protein CCHR01_09832 [Colletotrichum chrysophilum]|uniref:Uncharacterized protein n=1 Tax=Colletotrichum chrysophilum TaxID=1836956 RepID=A0AAD9AG29_9PEZI|nr:hypothetical protein CCHR01_09832 [Colletotrichum chrysophilum]
MGERTGSRVFQWVWSYVVEMCDDVDQVGLAGHTRDEAPPTATLRHPFHAYDFSG